MILPIPAIDVMGGQCVRLEKGDYTRLTVYGDSPVEMARKWEGKGAPMLHVVDLDGAKRGLPVNFPLVIKILETIRIPVQVGGGIRDLTTFSRYLEAGVTRIILGSVAIKNPVLLEQFLSIAPEKITVSIDSLNGKVALEGWTENIPLSASDLAKSMKQMGIQHFIYTDIARDGTLQGIDIERITAFLAETGVNIMVAGGISTLSDIQNLKSVRQGIEGVILGKSLYSGVLQYETVQKILQEV
ncbi:MAG: 1-(5-phosphoribosyl)-5-[(5-phosphoribosylamino)methylideneamino]imidazole-4-carboxamide isomerase [Atribacterota bacterium]|nr:1-(5-phosphoribosyl)-5-[(5-phosphoribosylamino)methylideneamino]imidazole-4-carboxamide isomerase [Candidatus Atribacteria bacterium]